MINKTYLARAVLSTFVKTIPVKDLNKNTIPVNFYDNGFSVDAEDLIGNEGIRNALRKEQEK